MVEFRYLEGKKHTWKEICNIVGYSFDYYRKEITDRILNKGIREGNNFI